MSNSDKLFIQYKASFNLTSSGPFPKKLTFKVTYRTTKDSHFVKKKTLSKPSVSEKVVKDVAKTTVKGASKKVLAKVIKDVSYIIVNKLKKLKSNSKYCGVVIKEISNEEG